MPDADPTPSGKARIGGALTADGVLGAKRLSALRLHDFLAVRMGLADLAVPFDVVKIETPVGEVFHCAFGARP